MSRKTSIWFIYPRVEVGQVMDCFLELKKGGYDPRLDRTAILPGQDWRRRICKNLSTVDCVLVFLTNDVIKRWGASAFYWEVMQALAIAERKFADDIFVIPIRLEECDVPPELEPLQWIDWFEQDNWDRLITSLGQVVYQVSRPWGHSYANNEAAETSIPTRQYRFRHWRGTLARIGAELRLQSRRAKSARPTLPWAAKKGI